MNITTKSTQELSLAMHDLIEDKFSALDKLVVHATTPATLACEIEESIAIERAGAKYRVEGNLTVDGKLFRAEANGSTLEDAVDRVRDELARSLESVQGKKRSLLKRGGAALKEMLRFGN